MKNDVRCESHIMDHTYIHMYTYVHICIRLMLRAEERESTSCHQMIIYDDLYTRNATCLQFYHSITILWFYLLESCNTVDNTGCN